MKKVFKWILLLTAIVAVGISIIFYKPGLIKTPVENFLSNQSGYLIRIDDDLEFSVGRKIQLTLTDVHVFNPEWAGEAALMTLGSLDLVLDAASIFDETITIDFLQLDQLSLRLETSTEGLGNWVVARNKTQKSQQREAKPVVIFDQVRLNTIALDYQNDKTGDTQSLLINTYSQIPQADGMLAIELDAALNGRRVGYTGSIGPHENLQQGKNIAFKGSGNLGSLSIVAEGLIDDLQQPLQPEFKLQLRGPDTDDITDMLGIDDLGTGVFSVNGRGETINGKYSASLEGSIGGLSLNLQAQASSLLDLQELNLELGITGPRLGAVTRIFGLEGWPDEPFALNAKAVRVGSNLSVPDLNLNIGSTRLKFSVELPNYPHLDSSRMNLQVEGDRIEQFRELLGIPGIADGAFKIQGKLDVSADEVQLIQLDAQTALGQASIEGTLGPGPAYLGTRLQITMDGHNSHALAAAFGVDALPARPFRLDTRVELQEQGLLIERGVLVSIGDDRLELGGLIRFKPGGEGSNIDFRLNGDNLAEMLAGLVPELQIPASPYELNASLDFQKDSVLLKTGKAVFESITLGAEGKIIPWDNFAGTEINLELAGSEISALKVFPALTDSINTFVSGQDYRVGGLFSLTEGNIHFDKVTGRVGATNFNFDGLFGLHGNTPSAEVEFVIGGPDFHALVKDKDTFDTSIKAFRVAGEGRLKGNTLSLDNFILKTDSVNAELDLTMGWPLEQSADVRFNIDLQGDDIRHLIPSIESFEPAQSAFKLTTAGQLSDDLISLKIFEASIGNFQLSVSGKLGDDPNDRSAELSIRANSKDISSLGRLYGDQLPAMALNLSADFEGNAKQFAIRQLSVALGESKVNGNLDVSLAGVRPVINLQLDSPTIDLHPFLLGKNAEVQDSENSKWLIPATPLPIHVLKHIDGDIRLTIKALRLKQGSLNNLIVTAELQRGGLNVSELSVKDDHGVLSARFSVFPMKQGKAEIKLDLVAIDFSLNLFGQSEEMLSQLPLFSMNTSVSGNGDNLRELAGSLNGTLQLASSGGVLEGVNLSVLDSFFLEDLFRLILPAADDDKDLQLKCAATILKINNGHVKTDPALAFTTNKISLIANGKLDLKTEKIKFNFKSIPNKAYKFSTSELINPYVLVGGTLKNPSVGIDPGKVLVKGGIALGTAGISILAKGALDRWGNTVPLCEEMLEKIK